MDNIIYEISNVGLTLLLVVVCAVIVIWVGDKL